MRVNGDGKCCEGKKNQSGVRLTGGGGAVPGSGEASWKRWHLRCDLELILMLSVSVLGSGSGKCQSPQ